MFEAWKSEYIICKQFYVDALIIYGSFSRIGRKKTLFIGIVFELASTLALAWSYNYLTYVILRFCTGAACVGVFMTTYVLGTKT